MGLREMKNKVSKDMQKIMQALLVVILIVAIGLGPVFADEWSEETGESTGYYNEAGEWVEYGTEAEGYYNEAGEWVEYGTETEGYYNEAGEWVVVDGSNEYTGEYAEDYSEESAWQEEEAWQEEWAGEWTEESTEGGTATSETEGETEQKEQTVLPIVAPDGTIRKPVLSSGSAAVYCKTTGELIFAKNVDKRFSPYSITKLLTALLAVQKLPLDQKVTISEAAAYQDGSTMFLQAGEVVTVEQLLYGTMILSGNDAAYALAETVSGDVETFVKLMNDTVQNLGCKNTHFVNPNGLIDDTTQQYTTARDFLEISKLAFANDTLRVIAGANEYDMPATNMNDAYKMEGHNELLMEGKSGYIAGKTGYWDDTKATIAMDYVDGNLELIVVALGGELDKRGSDCDQLIEYAVANVEGLKVVEPDKVVTNFKVKRGAVTRCDAKTAGESFIYLPKQASKELIQLVAVINEDITAPVKAGDPVGVYEVYLADEKIDEVPLVAASDVEEGWILSYLGISNRNTVIICFVLLALIAFFIIRAINAANSKRKKRQAHKAKVRSMAQDEIEQERKEFESHRGRYYK